MALSQRLDLRQSQSLVMTPQLQQAIKLLQLSNRELSEFVEEELEKNPVLERDEGENSTLQEASTDNMTAYDEAQVSESNAQISTDGFSEEATDDTLAITNAETLPEPNDDPNDVDYENNWGSASSENTVNADNFDQTNNDRPISGSGGDTHFDSNTFNIDETASDNKTLRQHLYEQLGIDFSNQKERIRRIFNRDD